MLIASIPSPPRNSLEVGPLEIHLYGIAVALGALVGIWVARRRYANAGGDPEQMDRIAFWAVVAGFVGARLAHVLANLTTYLAEPLAILAVWRGGLAFYGGLTVGAATAVWLARREGLDVARFADLAIVGVPVAQAIGRFGNYANQELFGRPTDLPWALEIDPEHRPARFAEFETFHPTFLYEQLWNLTIVGVLLAVERRRALPRGGLVLTYLVLYGLGRFLLELVRIDTEFRILGLSRNAWVSLVLVTVGGIALAVWTRRAGPPEETERMGEHPDGELTASGESSQGG